MKPPGDNYYCTLQRCARLARPCWSSWSEGLMGIGVVVLSLTYEQNRPHLHIDRSL